MRAVCWHAKEDVRVEDVPEPHIINPRDAIVRVTSTAICGSDLHLYDGYVPGMMQGDILGHEFMGEVVEAGQGVLNLEVGDRVVVPFPISCGGCSSCTQGLFSLCENSNPNARMAEHLWGHSPAGLYGYSHLTGGYAGGQAEYVRVPFADVGPLKIGPEADDEDMLFLSDILPTGYMAAEQCGIKEGDIVAVWGCGPVGYFAVRSAYLLGAQLVVAIDRFASRLSKVANETGALVLNYEEVDVSEALNDLTGSRGPDACIDAVGMEAHSPGVVGAYDRFKQALMLETGRPSALRSAIVNCKNGGTVSVPGVYGGFLDKIPMGSVVNRALTIKSGQTHVQRYLAPLLKRIEAGEFQPGSIVSHRMRLDDAPSGYEAFKNKEDDCFKVVLKPGTENFH